jgi:hypothetical protein
MGMLLYPVPAICNRNTKKINVEFSMIYQSTIVAAGTVLINQYQVHHEKEE